MNKIFQTENDNQNQKDTQDKIAKISQVNAVLNFI